MKDLKGLLRGANIGYNDLKGLFCMEEEAFNASLGRFPSLGGEDNYGGQLCRSGAIIFSMLVD